MLIKYPNPMQEQDVIFEVSVWVTGYDNKATIFGVVVEYSKRWDWKLLKQLFKSLFLLAKCDIYEAKFNKPSLWTLNILEPALFVGSGKRNWWATMFKQIHSNCCAYFTGFYFRRSLSDRWLTYLFSIDILGHTDLNRGVLVCLLNYLLSYAKLHLRCTFS